MALMSYLTAALVLGCGYSDFVYQDLSERIGERSTGQIVRPGRQGETNRRLYIFSDGSWFWSYEFFHFGDASKDISCIVAKGSDEEFPQALEFYTDELPEGDIGEGVERPEFGNNE